MPSNSTVDGSGTPFGEPAVLATISLKVYTGGLTVGLKLASNPLQARPSTAPPGGTYAPTLSIATVHVRLAAFR